MPVSSVRAPPPSRRRCAIVSTTRALASLLVNCLFSCAGLITECSPIQLLLFSCCCGGVSAGVLLNQLVAGQPVLCVGVHAELAVGLAGGVVMQVVVVVLVQLDVHLVFRL